MLRLDAPRAILITGPFGAGKSSLAGEIADLVEGELPYGGDNGATARTDHSRCPMPATIQPTVDRPGIPREYGVATGSAGMLAWETVEAQLAAARLFWVATTTSRGRPRVRPVDGTWFEGSIYVGGSPETAWVSDLLANPNVAVHLDSTDGVVIVDGVAESGGGGIAGDAAERLADLLGERFPYGRPKAEDFAVQGSIAIRPRVIVAWRDFAKDPTRFRFG